VAIYGRALNEDEIQRHYQLLRPPVQEKAAAAKKQLTAAADAFEYLSAPATHFN
jgi:hypothetical protein